MASVCGLCVSAKTIKGGESALGAGYKLAIHWHNLLLLARLTTGGIVHERHRRRGNAPDEPCSPRPRCSNARLGVGRHSWQDLKTGGL
ncbi:hypothetical protein MRX96_012020 [Rhipicephalus microplus]